MTPRDPGPQLAWSAIFITFLDDDDDDDDDGDDDDDDDDDVTVFRGNGD